VRVCDLCEQDKEKAYSCMKRIEGQIPFGDETQLSLLPHNCPECLVGTGGFHHLGCGVEQCPNCHGQILFCLCEGGEAYRNLTVNVWWTRLRRGLQESVVTDGQF
jgi:hypothetical protein